MEIYLMIIIYSSEFTTAHFPMSNPKIMDGGAFFLKKKIPNFTLFADKRIEKETNQNRDLVRILKFAKFLCE